MKNVTACEPFIFAIIRFSRSIRNCSGNSWKTKQSFRNWHGIDWNFEFLSFFPSIPVNSNWISALSFVLTESSELIWKERSKLSTTHMKNRSQIGNSQFWKYLKIWLEIQRIDRNWFYPVRKNIYPALRVIDLRSIFHMSCTQFWTLFSNQFWGFC
jgi:hypothetical protein